MARTETTGPAWVPPALAPARGTPSTAPAGNCRPGCPALLPGAIIGHGAGDPGPRYAHLRAEHPVYHDPLLDVRVLSRHQDIDTVLRDTTGAYTAAHAYTPLQALHPTAEAVLRSGAAVPVLSSLDPPHHSRFRRQMTATFPTTERRMTPHHGWIRGQAVDTARALAARPHRSADLLADYARPLSMSVIGHLLGVPVQDHPRIAEQATALSGLVWGHLTPPDQLAAAQALDDLWNHCHALVLERSQAPTDDLTSAWLAHRDTDGTPFTTREVASTLMEALITNAEVTPRLIANALHQLLTSRTLHTLHRAGELPRAVEETLRHSTPLIGWLRATTRATTLGEVPLPAGARLLLLLASAARDESHGLAGLDAFDTRRPFPPPHRAFGAGIHYCPGDAFSRHLTHQALAALADACPDLALSDPAAGPDSWPLNAALRGPHVLPATW
ncbi:cytochrome P450 [Streptomyces sp. NPDC096033]|uniref:cytochrome P450 n=1 Tax=Streptomyces sp. NPDC096033 TaxID=3366071 RepID=UPI0038121E20